LTKMSGRELEEIQRRYFKFAFTRNPYDRLLSAFLDKIGTTVESGQRTKAKHRMLVTQALKQPLGSVISFDMFVSYLEAGGINDDPHWCRQVDLIPLRLFEFDYIGKVEELEKDLSTVFTSIFGRQVDIPPIKSRGKNTGATLVRNEYYDRNLMKRVSDLYADDFEMFSYSREI
jgi:dermatan 4-sulfotransferase 1